MNIKNTFAAYLVAALVVVQPAQALDLGIVGEAIAAIRICQAKIDQDIELISANLASLEIEYNAYQYGLNSCLETGSAWGITCDAESIAEFRTLIQTLGKLMDLYRDKIESMLSARRACINSIAPSLGG